MKTKELSIFWAVVAIAVTLFLLIFPKQHQKPDFPPYPFSWFQCEYPRGELNLCAQLAEPKLADMQKWGAEEKVFSGIITSLKFFIVPIKNIAEQEQLSWWFSPDDKLEIVFYNEKALRLKRNFWWEPQYWFGKKNNFWFHNFFHQGYDEQDQSLLYKNFQVFQTWVHIREGIFTDLFDPEEEVVYEVEPLSWNAMLIPGIFSWEWGIFKNKTLVHPLHLSEARVFLLGGEAWSLYYGIWEYWSDIFSLYYGGNFLTGFKVWWWFAGEYVPYMIKAQSLGDLALYTHFKLWDSIDSDDSSVRQYLRKITPSIEKQKKLIEDYISALDSKNYTWAYAMLYQPRLSLQAFIDQQEALKLTMQVLDWKFKSEVPLLTLKKGKIWPTDPENENHYHIRVYQLQTSGGVALVDYKIQLIDGKLQVQEGWRQSPEAGLASVDFNKKARLAYNYAYFLKTGRAQEAYKLLKNPKSDFQSFLKKHQGWEEIYVSEYVPEEVKINQDGTWDHGSHDVDSDYFSLIIAYEKGGKQFFRWYSGKQQGEQLQILEERELEFSCTWLCRDFN